MTILIIGSLMDEPTAFVYARCLEMGVPVFFFDEVQYPSKISFSLYFHNDEVTGKIRFQKQTICLDEISGVYNRHFGISKIISKSEIAKYKERIRNLDAYISVFTWLNICSQLVLSRPSSFGSNNSKSYQLQLISECGFKIPPTLVTTNPKTAVMFYNKYKHQIISKSTSTIRSMVNKVSSNQISKFSNLSYCPTTFQKFIEGVNIRVHVIGNEVFSTAMITDAVDYRYATKQGKNLMAKPVTLPKKVARKCIKLAKHLNIPFAGIDLILASDNEYYCLEVNPTPGFTFFEALTRQSISTSLVKLLHNGKIPQGYF